MPEVYSSIASDDVITHGIQHQQICGTTLCFLYLNILNWTCVHSRVDLDSQKRSEK